MEVEYYFDKKEPLFKVKSAIIPRQGELVTLVNKSFFVHKVMHYPLESKVHIFIK